MIVEYDGDPVCLCDPAALADSAPPTVCRELVLTPRAFEGHQVLAAYDQPTDTLYIKAEP
jgi:hypothetical protein